MLAEFNTAYPTARSRRSRRERSSDRPATKDRRKISAWALDMRHFAHRLYVDSLPPDLLHPAPPVVNVTPAVARRDPHRHFTSPL